MKLLLSRIIAFKGVVAALGLMFTMAVLLSSALVFLIVGVWDGMVWLFKTDWQTTEFKIPVYAIGIAIPAYLFHQLFKDWVNKETQNCDE